MADQLQSFNVTPQEADAWWDYQFGQEPATDAQESGTNTLMSQHFERGRGNAQSSVVGAPSGGLPPQVPGPSPIPSQSTGQPDPFAVLDSIENYVPPQFPVEYRGSEATRPYIEGLVYQVSNGNPKSHAGSLQEWRDWLLSLQHGGEGRYADMGVTGQQVQEMLQNPPQGTPAEQEMSMLRQQRQNQRSADVEQQRAEDVALRQQAAARKAMVAEAQSTLDMVHLLQNPKATEAEKELVRFNPDFTKKVVDPERKRLDSAVDDAFKALENRNVSSALWYYGNAQKSANKLNSYGETVDLGELESRIQKLRGSQPHTAETGVTPPASPAKSAWAKW